MKPKASRPFILCLLIFCLVAGFPAVAGAAPPAAKTAAAADVPPSWLARVQQDIAAREYHVSPVKHKDPVSGGLLQAPTRRQNLRTWFIRGGIYDVALFYSANYNCYIKNQLTPTYGTITCIQISADYNGSGGTSLAARAATAMW